MNMKNVNTKNSYFIIYIKLVVKEIFWVASTFIYIFPFFSFFLL